MAEEKQIKTNDKFKTRENLVLKLKEKIFLENKLDFNFLGSNEDKIGINVCSMPKGCRPVITVFGKTVPEVWENSVIATYLYGVDIKTQYDKAEDPPSKDCRMMMVVKTPFQEPRIHKCFYDSVENLECYRQEAVEGVHDHWINPKEGKWTYTYHGRLRKYQVTDDMEELDSASITQNILRRELREYYRGIVKKKEDKYPQQTYEFIEDVELAIEKAKVKSKILLFVNRLFGGCNFDLATLTGSLDEIYDKYALRFKEGVGKFEFTNSITASTLALKEKGTVLIPPTDQIQYIIDNLSKSTYSRRAQGITWMPTADPKTDDPPCLQRVWCRMFPDEKGQQVLNMDTDWRSRDAFKAAFQNMFALTDLQRVIAERISEKIHEPVKIGPYVDNSSSYHIYGAYYKDFEEKFIDSLFKRTFDERIWNSEDLKEIFDEEKKRLFENPDYKFRKDNI